MQDIKWKIPVPSIPIHQTISLGGQIMYAPGDWGTDIPVGETVRVEAVRRDLQFRFPALVLDAVETNPNGEFMMMINSNSIRVGKDYVFLAVFDKTSNKKSSFNITNMANWQLTMQSQLLNPLAVHWGPNS
jgi:hypothetical protein